MRIYYFITLLLLLVSGSFSIAQTASQKKQIAIANKFLTSYNQQDYTRFKKSFFLLARLLPIKTKLKQEFAPRYTKYGTATIKAIQYPTDSKIVVELNYEKDPGENDFINIYFNKRNKIIGFNFKEPGFLYSKNEDIVTNKTSDENKALRIDSLMKRKFTNGFSGNVIVTDNGNLIYKNSFGYSESSTKTLLNDSSVFELASCSKQFTGIAIMMLAEQGKLKYTDTIQKYIPDLPYQNITIENLLTHTSGLPDYMELFEKHWDRSKFATNYDMVELFKKFKPKVYYQPNETFDYSNTGYALLSIIIEKASGMSYAEFLDKNIFKPLNMRNSRVYNTRRVNNEKINNYAYGYVLSEKNKAYALPDSLPDYKYVIYLDAITGDGTVNTTAIDLVKWDKALREHKLIQQKTIERAFTKYKVKSGREVNYGYGQSLCFGNNKERVAQHGGGWPGYRTFILHFIDRQTMIAILCNNENEDVTKLADRIALIVLDSK